jgi:Pregnancy-associated plasma protein-A
MMFPPTAPASAGDMQRRGMKRMRFISAFALALALYTAATVGTASGARAQTVSAGALNCTTLSASALARGGVVREPDIAQVHKELPASAQGEAGANFSATVPVYFHVVSDGSTGSLTRSQILAQIRVLNNTFGGGEGGADTGFTFELVAITRTDNAKWFNASIGGAEHAMKRALRQGGRNALNIYSTTAGPYLGWAYLPSILDSPSQAYLDGVVVDWESWLGTSDRYEDEFDQGETGTHEVGHWLNLEHTFYKGCTVTNDFVADTPAQKTPTSGCPEGKDTCPEPGLDPIHNYMDYSFDSCYTEFTPGQAQRMKDAWLFYRA